MFCEQMKSSNFTKDEQYEIHLGYHCKDKI